MLNTCKMILASCDSCRELVCVIYGTDGTDKLLITETRANQAEGPRQAGEWEGAA